MRRIILLLLIFFSINSYAENSDSSTEGVINLTDKESKISICIDDYKKKQSKAYTKIVQDNLYDLMYNFNNIALRIDGKKRLVNDISHEEKIEALAKIQCEVYYTIGVLK